MIEIKAQQLHQLWKVLGIQPGMVVMCHSFLPSLGRLQPGPEIVIETILNQLGPSGTFVVPTFTYSYFKKEIYDLENSPSTVGALGDLVRAYPGAIRSLDPNFSMAASGGDAASLMERTGPRTFGLDTIYDKLMNSDMQILLLGVDFTALSLFMHLEHLNDISYRYEKSFRGKTQANGRLFEDTAIHFVRDEKLDPESDRRFIGSQIDLEPDCIQTKFGYGEHRVVPAATIARVVAENLAKDPYCLIKFLNTQRASNAK